MKRAVCALAITLLACSSDPGLVGGIPTNPDALQGWLEEERYADWESEDAAHPTTGPHRSHVLTFFNHALVTSMGTEAVEHIVESAAVKEMYEEGELVGWAVMIKTDPGLAGDSWYWYEVVDRTSPKNRFEGQGLELCVGCHAQGEDHVRTTWP